MPKIITEKVKITFNLDGTTRKVERLGEIIEDGEVFEIESKDIPQKAQEIHSYNEAEKKTFLEIFKREISTKKDFSVVGEFKFIVG